MCGNVKEILEPFRTLETLIVLFAAGGILRTFLTVYWFIMAGKVYVDTITRLKIKRPRNLYKVVLKPEHNYFISFLIKPVQGKTKS